MFKKPKTVIIANDSKNRDVIDNLLFEMPTESEPAASNPNIWFDQTPLYEENIPALEKMSKGEIIKTLERKFTQKELAILFAPVMKDIDKKVKKNVRKTAEFFEYNQTIVSKKNKTSNITFDELMNRIKKDPSRNRNITIVKGKEKQTDTYYIDQIRNLASNESDSEKKKILLDLQNGKIKHPYRYYVNLLNEQVEREYPRKNTLDDMLSNKKRHDPKDEVKYCLFMHDVKIRIDFDNGDDSMIRTISNISGIVTFHNEDDAKKYVSSKDYIEFLYYLLDREPDTSYGAHVSKLTGVSAKYILLEKIDENFKHKYIDDYEVNDLKAYMYTVEQFDDTVQTNGCFTRFLVEGLQLAVDDKKTKRTYRNLTVQSIDEKIDSIHTVKSLKEYCESRKISLALCYQNLDCFYHKVHRDTNHTQTLYGMVYDGHISLIKCKETQKYLSGQCNTKPTYNMNRDALTEYKVCNRDDVQSVYCDLVNYFESRTEEEKDKQFVFVITKLKPMQMHQLIDYIYNKEMLLVESVSYNNTGVSRFTYKNIFVKYDSDYHACVDLCKQLELKYTGQTIIEIGDYLLNQDQEMGKSEMSTRTFEIFKKLKPLILKDTFLKKEDLTVGCLEIDVKRSYTSILFRSEFSRYIYGTHCNFRPVKVLNIKDIKPGHYIVKKLIHGKRNIVLSNEVILHDGHLKEFYKMDCIELEDIVEHIEPSGFYETKYFKKMLDAMQKLTENYKGTFKSLVNLSIGSMGKMESKNFDAIASSDIELLHCMMMEEKLETFRPASYDPIMKSIFEDDFDSDPVEDDFSYVFLGLNSKTVNCYQNNRPIQQDIVNEGSLRLLKLENRLLASGISIDNIVGYKTDAIFIRKAGLNVDLVKSVKSRHIVPGTFYGNYEYTFKSLQKFDDKVIPVIEYSDYRKWNNLEEKLEKNKSCLIIGAPGVGKSYKLLNEILPMYNPEDCIIVCPTHKAVSNLTEKTSIHVRTVASYFAKNSNVSHNMFIKCMAKKLSGKVFILDEVGLTTYTDLVTIYNVIRACEVKPTCYLIGDFSQCQGVGLNWRVSDSDMLKELVDCNRLELTKVHRYDEGLKALCEEIKETHSITNMKLKTSDKKLYDYSHVCFRHVVRIDVNNRCMLRYIKDHPEREYYTLEAKETKKKYAPQTAYLYKGLPVVACETKEDYFNREMFIINEVDRLNQIIKLSSADKLIECSFKKFHKKFRVGYCSTIHSTQAVTITGKLCIHEIGNFDWQMAYTGVSRATKLENISFYSSSQETSVSLRETYYQQMIDYTDLNNVIGCIYQLVNKKNRVFYIGQTNDMTRRLSQHKEKYGNNIRMEKLLDVYKGQDIDEIETEMIHKGQKAGYKLKNKDKIIKEEVLTKVTAINEATERKTRDTDRGNIYDSGTYLRLKYSINGVKYAFKRAYGEIRTHEEAMVLIREKQKEVFGV